MSSTIPNDSRSVVIYIPTSNFEFFKANRQSILDSAGFNNQVQADSMATSVVEKLVKKRYKVKKGQTLYDVARILQVSVSDLKKLNRLRSNKIKKGKTLAYFVRVKQQVVASATVSGKDEADVEEAEPIVKKKSKKTKARYHKVRSGDTLSEIADRYPGLTVSKLKKLNHLRASSTLRLGMRLRIN
jgi:membrane-bound lytic murein transglycosylase D